MMLIAELQAPNARAPIMRKRSARGNRAAPPVEDQFEICAVSDAE
jgi:hypothetical protein